MAAGEHWERLGELVKARRGYIGYKTRKQFTEATGFPTKTLSDLEQHHRENFDVSTLAKLEAALRWPAGAIESVLQGGPPSPLPPDSASGPLPNIVPPDTAAIRHADGGVTMLGQVPDEVVRALATLNSGTLLPEDREMLLRMIAYATDLACRASWSQIRSGAMVEELGLDTAPTGAVAGLRSTPPEEIARLLAGEGADGAAERLTTR